MKTRVRRAAFRLAIVMAAIAHIAIINHDCEPHFEIVTVRIERTHRAGERD